MRRRSGKKKNGSKYRAKKGNMFTVIVLCNTKLKSRIGAIFPSLYSKIFFSFLLQNLNPAYFNCMNIFFDISNVEISASMVFFCVIHKKKKNSLSVEKKKKKRQQTLSSLAVRTLTGTVSSYSGCDSILTIFCKLSRAKSNFFSHLLISFSRSTRP